MDTPELIALLALAFTLFSFWWLQVRPGRLEVSEPITYACGAGNGELILHLPLVLRNPGAVPLVVRDIEVRLIDSPEPRFYWNAFMAELPRDSVDPQWARSQAIPARGQVEWVYEFHRRQIDPIVPDEKETLRVQLKALVENERRFLSVRREPAWRLVREFDLYETVWSASQLLTRRNGPLD